MIKDRVKLVVVNNQRQLIESVYLQQSQFSTCLEIATYDRITREEKHFLRLTAIRRIMDLSMRNITND